MSLESALRFLEESRSRPALRQEIGLLSGEADYETLCAIAARYDYVFTPAELATAFDPLLTDDDPWVRALARLQTGKMRVMLGDGTAA